SFSGVDTANPIDVWNGQATASSTTHATPDVTTTVANTLLVAAHAMASGSVYWTPPTGMTEIVDVQVGSTTGGITLEGSNAVQATAGATGAKTATNAANTTPYPGGIQAFSRADPAIDAENGQTDTASVTSHATPSVNTTYTNTMIITSYGVGATSTWTQPLGMNETADAQGGSQAFEMNWVLQAAP